MLRRLEMRLSSKIIEYISSRKAAHYATCSGSKPHVVPVSHVIDPSAGAVYFVTDYGTKKLKNTKENSSVAVVFDSRSKGVSQGVMLTGSAVVLERGAEYRQAREMLFAAYPKYKKPPLYFEEGEAPIIKIIPEEAATWGL